jgi:hypothetical protein
LNEADFSASLAEKRTVPVSWWSSPIDGVMKTIHQLMTTKKYSFGIGCRFNKYSGAEGIQNFPMPPGCTSV